MKKIYPQWYNHERALFWLTIKRIAQMIFFLIPFSYIFWIIYIHDPCETAVSQKTWDRNGCIQKTGLYWEQKAWPSGRLTAP